MKKAFGRLIGLLLAALLLGGCGAGMTAAPRERALQLWLVEGDPLADALPALAAQYGEQEPETKLFVTRFADEAALEAALEVTRPDLLLCSDGLMRELDAGGQLCSLALSEGDTPRFLPAFAALGDVLGSCYFPLGADTELLVVRVESAERFAGCDSLEALCAAASAYAGETGGPARFAVDSLCALFERAMTQKGLHFSGEDNSAGYCALYNLLAQAVFDGGLCPETRDLPAALGRGELAAALCASRTLAGLDGTAFCFLPPPAYGGGEALSRAEIWGLAVLAQDETRSDAARFVTWLCSYDRAVSAAISEGLLPAEAGRWLSCGEGAIVPWAAVAGRLHFWLPASDETLPETEGAVFEQRVRAALLRLQE